jgi:hypothetical protein
VSEINRIYRLLAVAGLAGAMLLVTACASAPTAPPTSLNEANLAIEAAERVDASHFANAELDEARQKLMLAEKAVVAENLVMANRYAEQSTLTAELATARTEAAKAAAVNEEMRRSAKALIEEMQRTGDQQ